MTRVLWRYYLALGAVVIAGYYALPAGVANSGDEVERGCGCRSVQQKYDDSAD